ncbi:MAG: hypothetical protein GY903_15740 [Fuerstiella sp.]|nr:hypothetical protein [Fuerstiella sp.]MCP4855934.1 hypothetical protein [Fuerstiella sp.]
MTRRRKASIIFACLLCVGSTISAVGQNGLDRNDDARRPENYRSQNFLIHTDLARDDAEALLQKMETMLKIISRYWGAPNRKTIECYVVDNLNYWPAGSLSPNVRATVSQGGITIAQGSRRGNQLNMNAIVYASNSYGTPQHEAVHAYCYQTFGVTGPTWYAEGMAELGNYWVEDDTTVTAPDYVIRHLKRSPRKSLEEITDYRQRTGDGWQNYTWRWALCHFLVNNRNYYDRFRPMGVGFLTGRPSTFARSYASRMKELKFEFEFFVDHLDRGFDIDRCVWNWKARYREQKGTRPVVARIRADKGWQPGGLKVVKGQDYHYTAEGTWRTSKDSEEAFADGGPTGNGKLIGILFNDYELSAPIELGTDGTFTATGDGQLLLRCSDAWNRLSDNKGTISVEFMSAKDD